MRWTSVPRASENPAGRAVGRHDDHVERAAAGAIPRRGSGGGRMELAHEFTVNTPIDRAWAVLTDVERIAPCMPGAELTEVDGDTYHGLVKVKVGPITAQYKGTASFVEKDEAAHRAVLKAAGRDARGQGNASATVTAVMTEQADGTRVTIATNMTVSGRVAQFGRGVMAD